MGSSENRAVEITKRVSVVLQDMLDTRHWNKGRDRPPLFCIFTWTPLSHIPIPQPPVPSTSTLGRARPDFQIGVPTDCLAHRDPTLNYSLLFRISILAVFGEGNVRKDRSPRHLNLPKIFRRQVYTVRVLHIRRE